MLPTTAAIMVVELVLPELAEEVVVDEDVAAARVVLADSLLAELAATCRGLLLSQGLATAFVGSSENRTAIAARKMRHDCEEDMACTVQDGLRIYTKIAARSKFEALALGIYRY